MTTKHTPGQWYASKPGTRQPMIASEANGMTIAIVYDHVADSERDANARLIAKAPEMRELLEDIDATTSHDADCTYRHGAECNCHRAKVSALLATIDGTEVR